MIETSCLGGNTFNILRSFNVFSLALAAGLILSPDNLALFGNSLGAMGWLLFLLMPVGILIHLATIHSFGALHDLSGDPIIGIQKMLGRRNAAIILICGKLPFAVCASAGLVVSAGFVFNEVFFYWFPNFAFAFLLLAAILLLNLVSTRAVLVTQGIAVFTACIGLLILTGAGLFSPGDAGGISETNFNLNYRYLTAAAIVLVGFDMGLYADWNVSDSFSQRSHAMVIALIGGGFLLMLWGFATMSVVPYVKLESSTVPYMLMARNALGQTGRFIMGALVILSVFAAVNSMIHSVSTMITKLTFAKRKSAMNVAPKKARVTTILFMSGASAFLMAMGFAGEPVLETWIRSSLVLWLIYYTAVNISAYHAGHHAHASTDVGQGPSGIPLQALSIAGTALAVVGLILLEPEPLDVLVFIAVIAAAVAIVVSGIDFFC